MATRNFNVSKDARVADNGSDLGAGASDFLPVGLYDGFLYRSLLDFSTNFTDMTTITSAVLYLKTSSQYYVAFGSDPDVEVRRITGTWSEGSSVSLSGSNAVDWGNKPATSSTHMATFDVSTSENDWVTVDITDIINDVFTGSTFHGLELRAVNEASATDVTEFYAREYGSNDAYIKVTYTTGAAPTQPTINTAWNMATNDTTPDLSFNNNGDAATSWDIEVAAWPFVDDFITLEHSAYNQTSDLTNPIIVNISTTM